MATLAAQSPSSLSLASRMLRAAGIVFGSPLAVFCLALVARLKVLSELLPEHAWNSFYRYNEPSHIAWALASGLGYSAPWPNTPILPTAQQPPLYPALVAGIFKLTGVYTYTSLWLALGLNAIFSALTAILILRIGRRDFGSVTGMLAAWTWSCWLYEAAVSIRLWESSLAALCLMIGFLLLPDLAETLKWKPWLLFGALTGVAALINTTLLAVFPFIWLWLWISYRRRGRSCNTMLLASVGVCVLVLLPWTIRNYQVFHRLMPVRDNFGLELWVGIELGPGRPKPVITRLFPHDFPLSDPTEYNRLGELTFMESRMRLATQYILQNPRDYLEMVTIRCGRFWSEPGGLPPWWMISALAWLGAALAIARKGMAVAPYVVALVTFPVVYYITHTFPTYRHPIEPVILLLAAYSLVSVGQAIHQRIGMR